MTDDKKDENIISSNENEENIEKVDNQPQVDENSNISSDEVQNTEQKNQNNIMSRKRKAPVRKIYPDPKYRSVVISKFINSIMYDGKRSTAEKILYDALDKIKQKGKISFIISSYAKNCGFKDISSTLKCKIYKPLISTNLIN